MKLRCWSLARSQPFSPKSCLSWSLFACHLPRQGFPQPCLITRFQIWILGAVNFPGDCCQWEGRKDLYNYHLYFHETHELKSRARIWDNKTLGLKQAGGKILPNLYTEKCELPLGGGTVVGPTLGSCFHHQVLLSFLPHRCPYFCEISSGLFGKQ